MTSLSICLIYFIPDYIKKSTVDDEIKFIPELLITAVPFFFVYMSVSFFIPALSTKLFKYPNTMNEEETEEKLAKSKLDQINEPLLT